MARLIAHLKLHGIALALATSTPRSTLERKLSTKAAVRQAFLPHLCVCGDEVTVRAGWLGGGMRACWGSDLGHHAV